MHGTPGAGGMARVLALAGFKALNPIYRGPEQQGKPTTRVCSLACIKVAEMMGTLEMGTMFDVCGSYCHGSIHGLV